MKRSVGATALYLLLAGCAGSGSTSVPSSVPTQAATASTPSASLGLVASLQPTPSPVAGSASGALPPPSSGTLGLCQSPNAGAACSLSPGLYTNAIHDAYTLSINDPGWQQERPVAPAEDADTVILSRTDAPDQRLSIDTGDTSNILDDAAMAALVADTAPFQVSAPSVAHVGMASGYQVDLAPTEVIKEIIRGAGSYTLKPGHRYRLMALQLPMDQESGIKVIIVDAPTATFDAFLPRANAVLQTVDFK